jgi:hypothetical protein
MSAKWSELSALAAADLAPADLFGVLDVGEAGASNKVISRADLAGSLATDFYTKTQADSAFLKSAGGQMSGRLTMTTPPWTGSFEPPIHETAEPDTGWMVHPARIGVYSWIKSGAEAIRLSHDAAETQISAPNATNRFSFHSPKGFSFYTQTGVFELEAMQSSEITIIGYQISTANSKSIVFDTAVGAPQVPLIARGAGDVDIFKAQDSDRNDVFNVGSNGELSAKSVAVSGAMTSSGADGIGYSAGAGGATSQHNSKSTAVVLNKATGNIVMSDESLAPGATATFVLFSSSIGPEDLIVATHHAVGQFGAYSLAARATGTGVASISVRNNSAAVLSEAIVIKFSVLKGATS